MLPTIFRLSGDVFDFSGPKWVGGTGHTAADSDFYQVNFLEELDSHRDLTVNITMANVSPGAAYYLFLYDQPTGRLVAQLMGGTQRIGLRIPDTLGANDSKVVEVRPAGLPGSYELRIEGAVACDAMCVVW